MCWFRRRDDRVASNLTRDEAAARSSLITVTSYQVDLDLTARADDDATFGSVSVIRFGCAVPGSATFVDLTAPGVRESTLNATPVMPTYITAVAAGPYHVVRDEHDGIPLGVHCRQSLASYLDADEIFEVTRQGFDFFHSSFGIKYPFGKYDQLFVPEFKEGAMENAGCVTFVEAYIFRSRVTDFAREARAETILHDIAHMC